MKVLYEDIDAPTSGIEVSYFTLLQLRSIIFTKPITYKGNLHCPLGQNHPQHNLLIRHPFAHLGAFQKWHFQDISIPFDLPKEITQICIPANSKGELPSTKKWIPWLELQESLSGITSKVTCRDISNVICEIRVQRPYSKWHSKLFDCGGRRIVVFRLGPSKSRKVIGQGSALVREPVALFKS